MSGTTLYFPTNVFTFILSAYRTKMEQAYSTKNENYVSGSILQHDGVKEETIEVEFKSLKSIMKQLGHRHIDILKMDIEGAEFQVIKNILSDGIQFYELCVEFHDRMFKNGIKMLSETLFLLKKH